MAKKRDVTQQRELLSAATWEVLTESGLAALTLRAVAAKAGCTTGLVLHTLANRRHLLLHARSLMHDRANDRAEILEAEGGESAAVLLKVLRAILALTPEGRDEARVWTSFLAACIDDDELQEVHVRGNLRFLKRITRLVSVCGPELSDQGVRDEAAGLMALVEGLNALSIADPQTYSAQQQERALTTALGRSGLSRQPLALALKSFSQFPGTAVTQSREAGGQSPWWLEQQLQ